MTPNLISYYPKYSILDDIIKSKNYKEVNLFIDLKNIMKGLYIKPILEVLIENTSLSKRIDTSIFTSLINFLSFHKTYSYKRNIDLNVFVFFETGESYYHTNISKTYKSSRKIDKLFGLETTKKELITSIIQKNLQLIEFACNKLPSIKILKLDNLEADFIPYYLITRNLVNRTDDTCNILYSTDHDMLQTLVDDNTFIINKMQNKITINKKDNINRDYLDANDIPDQYFPLLLSIIGDSGDNVDGIKKIGKKTIGKIFPDLLKILVDKDMDNMYQKILRNEDIFLENNNLFDNKNINTIYESEKNSKFISNNLKLVSFELISRFFDNGSTDVIAKKQKLIKTLNDETLTTYEDLKKVCISQRIDFEDIVLESLFNRVNINNTSSYNIY